MIITQYDFVFYPSFDSGPEKYPDLNDGGFSMSLQTEDNFYTAIVRYDFVFKDISIEFYNDNDEMIQPRKRCSSGINLFYLIGYYLVWDSQNNRFIFGSGSEDEILDEILPAVY